MNPPPPLEKEGGAVESIEAVVYIATAPRSCAPNNATRRAHLLTYPGGVLDEDEAQIIAIVRDGGVVVVHNEREARDRARRLGRVRHVDDLG